MSDPLNPTAALLSKLGSIIVHVEEFLSPEGHPLDQEAIKGLLADSGVREWLEQMHGLVLLPVKRGGK